MRPASEWKYIPIMRLMLFIEEWLYRGAKWVVCEANDGPPWARQRLRPADAKLGIVNVDVGFAPLKPAEFIVITIHQIAGREAAHHRRGEGS